MIERPYEPISVLYLFPVYQTRQDYEARTGKTCPEFDPSRPTKHWEDLTVPDKKRVVLYERVLATDGHGVPLEEDGHPFFEPVVLSADHARTVNIPPKEAANEHNQYDIGVPCRALEGDEVLVFKPGVPFRLVMVHRPSLVPKDEPAQWTIADRELLRKIAEKLEVEL